MIYAVWTDKPEKKYKAAVSSFLPYVFIFYSGALQEIPGSYRQKGFDITFHVANHFTVNRFILKI